MAFTGALPAAESLAELVDRRRRDDLVLSVAAASEFGEVEALARAGDPRELFAPLDARLLDWFTAANPSGPGFLVVARDAGDRSLVGHFLFYANELAWSGPQGREIVPAYLYVHLYVRPDQRRRGIFGAMFGFGLEVLGRMGVPFAYTVPNQRSSPGFRKFGVPLLGQLPVRMAPAWRAWSGAARVLAGGASPVDVERVERFVPAMLAGPGSGDGGPDAAVAEVTGSRSVAGLNWRYPGRPGADYGVWRLSVRGTEAGYIVTRVLQIQKYRVLSICDFDIRPLTAPNLRAALAVIGERSSADRPDLVMLQGGPPDLPARRALFRAGLVRVPERLLPQPVVVFGGPPSDSPTLVHLPRLNRWHITPCDWDVF